jgi:ferredoxin
MSRRISSPACKVCGLCLESCPYGAVKRRDGRIVIDPAICRDCDDKGSQPLCVISCPQSLPQASKARLGRSKLLARDHLVVETNSPQQQERFASSLPVWEAASLLSQGTDGCQGDHPRHLIERHSQQVWLGLGLAPELRADPEGLWRSPTSCQPLPRQAALVALAGFDPRAVALHLVLAARAAALQEPWSQPIVLDDRYLEDLLGLDRRRDLNRPQRLGLIKSLLLQVLRLVLDLRCEATGQLPEINLSNDPLWRLDGIDHHFQADEAGQVHLAGLTFHLRAGGWSRYFLNAAGQQKHQALLQYGILPDTLPHAVMRHWQQHPGAVRLMVWLLFKLRLGQQHTLLVSTLMRIAYGSERLAEASHDREQRKRLVRTYESDLLVLLEEGLRPRFHPELYPQEIRPLWHAMEVIPDDPDEALAFWTNNGASDQQLGMRGTRHKFKRLLDARIQGFELAPPWRLGRGDKPARKDPEAPPPIVAESMEPDRIKTARRSVGLSQRTLAERMQRSQSWVRDLESGRCKPSQGDQQRLREILAL